MMRLSVLGLLLLPLIISGVKGCTTVAVSPEASSDGSSMVSHSNDGDGDTDPRLVRVPAADHAAGSMRDIFFSPESFPRYVGYSRNVSDYFPVKGQPTFKTIGQIPQVPHTFAYFEETYGVINEKQVGIAESTCSGIFGTVPKGQGGKAIMSVDTLSQIAMERASTARQAVQLMGDLAVKYGFYGAGSFEGSAESLLVSDPKEVWVFHILPDDTNASAIWVAQKVPSGEVAVVPNIFIIRAVNLKDTDNFLGSENMFSIAQKKGLWKPGQKFDWTAIFSDGEYAHKYYSGRRLWRAQSMLAPSLKLPTEYEGNLKFHSPYPFSIKPDNPVSLHDVMAIMRDSLEGTPFDMTKGLAAGPFGSPDRWVAGAGEREVKGNWERPIALFRTSDSYVVQSRSWLPDMAGGLVWFGPHGAHATVYVPFAIGMEDMSVTYRTANPRKLSRGSAYWAHRYVENLANLRWRDMIQDIKAEALALEGKSAALVRVMDNAARSKSTSWKSKATQAYINNAEEVACAWWTLADALMEKYADGYVDLVPQGYPAWWLNSVGYPKGPPDVPPSAQAHHVNQVPGGPRPGHKPWPVPASSKKEAHHFNILDVVA